MMSAMAALLAAWVCGAPADGVIVYFKRELC